MATNNRQARKPTMLVLLTPLQWALSLQQMPLPQPRMGLRRRTRRKRTERRRRMREERLLTLAMGLLAKKPKTDTPND